ncbi:histidine kinase [Dactylosporangium sp. NPDC049742]|uniref:sensor histidine kinase n=1 Tax=Dactylosporangium sp. NPDC049742 TaxID=3154737 RepID=UPI00344A4200
MALGLPILVELTPQRVLAWWAACLLAAVLLAVTPLFRRLEVTALSELLDVDVPRRADPVYLTALTSLHLYGGATLSAGLVALSPELVRAAGLRPGAPGDSAEVLLAAVAILAAMVVAGFGQRWAARRLLRTEPSRVLDQLGRRQALAMELHDAVGHALSVVLVQAMAAQSALQRPDPAAAVESLEHVTATARHAQQDLDVLLGVLDDGVSAQTPTLAALGMLTSGLDVHASVGDVHKVPAAPSRAAFAIAREALTNALRHGRGPVTLDLAVGPDLVLTVDNATVDNATVGTPGGPGRGLTGMRMRARLAGGTCTWQQVDGTWRVQARLPL